MEDWNGKQNVNFDENDNEIEEIKYNLGGIFHWKILSSYNESGKLLESKTYDLNGEQIGTSTYKYNKIGNEIECNSYTKEGDLHSFTYTYEGFDKKENWIKMSIYSNNEFIGFRVRDIKYY